MVQQRLTQIVRRLGIISPQFNEYIEIQDQQAWLVIGTKPALQHIPITIPTECDLNDPFTLNTLWMHHQLTRSRS